MYPMMDSNSDCRHSRGVNYHKNLFFALILHSSVLGPRNHAVVSLGIKNNL